MRRTLGLLLALTAISLAACKPVAVVMPAHALKESVEISVFLEMDAAESEKLAVEAALREVPGSSEVRFRSRDEAYELFKKTFEDEPELVARVRPEDLPESFWFTLADRTTVEPVLADVRQLPGVAEANILPKVMPTPPR